MSDPIGPNTVIVITVDDLPRDVLVGESVNNLTWNPIIRDRSRRSDDIGVGTCTWIQYPAFDETFIVSGDYLVLGWSQFAGSGESLQFGVNRCDTAWYGYGPWGSTESHGSALYEDGGHTYFAGVVGSKVPFASVFLKIKLSELPGIVEFELIAESLGYYNGAALTTNRLITGITGLSMSHVISEITDGDGFLKLRIDPATSTARITAWK